MHSSDHARAFIRWPKVPQLPKEFDMTQWTKPQATDLRYGFEITMYISNR